MKKILILTLLGFGFLTHTAQALPDLKDYGYNTTNETISGASHIIRALGSDGEIIANLKDGKIYQFLMTRDSEIKLKNLKTQFEAFPNKVVTEALKNQKLNLLRSGTQFSLSDLGPNEPAPESLQFPSLENDYEIIFYMDTADKLILNAEKFRDTGDKIRAYVAFFADSGHNSDTAEMVMQQIESAHDKDQILEALNKAPIGKKAKSARK